MREEVLSKAQETLSKDGIHLDPEDVTIQQGTSTVKVGYKDGSVEVPVSQNVINEAVKYIVGAAIIAAGVVLGTVLTKK